MLRTLHVVLALTLIAALTIGMGLVTLLLSFFDRTGEWQHGIARLWCRLIALIVGLRPTAAGLHHLPRNMPAVIMANHQSLLDIPVLFAFLPFQFRILAKKELFRIPFLGWFLWRAGHIPVDRGNRSATLLTMRMARKVLAAGLPIVIFPEGTRNTQPAQTKAFKPGGFRLAQEAGVPIIPVTIYGTAAFLPARTWRLTPCPVFMTVHPPIPPQGSLEDLMREVAAVMNRQLAAHAEQAARPASSSPMPLPREESPRP
ncbi:MAG: 1-acyl-sn-glycerol-3-phosphate acyltransferase [Chloracidobacterium sp.]|nr:1-acyl-sn-glycerol-3-phosphate acyltransferase [Chloracidobacterium sp.]MDW8216980.1 lysophospholipid acyltransferase family protein [Acidobacteriota bacterium]